MPLSRRRPARARASALTPRGRAEASPTLSRSVRARRTPRPLAVSPRTTRPDRAPLAELVMAQVTEEPGAGRGHRGDAPAALNRRAERNPGLVRVLPKAHLVC